MRANTGKEQERKGETRHVQRELASQIIGSPTKGVPLPATHPFPSSHPTQLASPQHSSQIVLQAQLAPDENRSGRSNGMRSGACIDRWYGSPSSITASYGPRRSAPVGEDCQCEEVLLLWTGCVPLPTGARLCVKEKRKDVRARPTLVLYPFLFSSASPTKFLAESERKATTESEFP